MRSLVACDTHTPPDGRLLSRISKHLVGAATPCTASAWRRPQAEHGRLGTQLAKPLHLQISEVHLRIQAVAVTQIHILWGGGPSILTRKPSGPTRRSQPALIAARLLDRKCELRCSRNHQTQALQRHTAEAHSHTLQAWAEQAVSGSVAVHTGGVWTARQCRERLTLMSAPESSSLAMTNSSRLTSSPRVILLV